MRSIEKIEAGSTNDEFSADMSLAALIRLHRRVAKAPALPPAKLKARVAVLANHSTQFLEFGLKLAMRARDVDAEIFASPFNQWESELLDPASATSAFRPDVVVLSLTSMLLAYREAANDPTEFAERLAALVTAAAARTGAKFLVTLPEPLEEEQETTSWAAGWRQRLVDAITLAIGEQASLLDLAPLIARLGTEKWYASRYLINGKFLANPEATASLADYVARQACAILKRPTRLVVVDLDDTLWGGIVGEEGWQNVDLDIDGKGFGFLRLQRFLLGLYEKGVVLAAVSKNNPDDALDVFRNRREMILREEHFSAMQINWEPKSVNVDRILEDLNLTQTGAAFIDDSAFERGEVRRLFPEIFVPEFPDDPVDLVPSLIASGRFAIPRVTSEDRKRQQMYGEERRRRAEKSRYADLDEYYRSLKLVMTVHPIGADNEARVLDLLAKTNQFNPTSRRYHREALEGFLAHDDNVVFAYSLEDVHGSYGLIGAVVALREGPDLRIDSWVMSCRAMGRTVERAALRHLAEQARALGIERLVGEYIETNKNKPVAQLYPSLGFEFRTETGGAKLFSYDLGRALPKNEFVTIEARRS